MTPDGISFVTLRTVLISLSLRFLIYNMAEIWSGFVSILPFIYLLTDYIFIYDYCIRGAIRGPRNRAGNKTKPPPSCNFDSSQGDRQ